ncbi:MAG: hypothetical protein AAGJ79_11070 [Verrucomicrobiota bacterium]
MATAVLQHRTRKIPVSGYVYSVMASRDRLLISSTVLFACLAVGGFGWAFKLSGENQKLRDKATRAEANANATEEEMKETISTLESEQLEAMASAEERFASEQAGLRTEYTERMTSAYNEFANVVENGQQALRYIDTLEGKIQSGQQLSQNEINRLTSMASGLDLLRQKYEAPMQDFQELGNYFEKQASVQVQQPHQRFKRMRRLFNRDYRDQEVAYQQAVGQQSAFTEANKRYQGAYTDARRKMTSATQSMDAHAQRLAALTAEKAQNHAELEQFFRDSRKAIQIHLDVLDLDFEPPALNGDGS